MRVTPTGCAMVRIGRCDGATWLAGRGFLRPTKGVVTGCVAALEATEVGDVAMGLAACAACLFC